MKLLLLLFTFLIQVLAYGQTLQDNNLTKFIPNGFHLINEYSGDLNEDTLEDKLLLLGLDKTAYEELFPDSIDYGAWHPIGNRPLIILLRQKDNSLKVAARNDEVIFDEPAGGFGCDAFGGLSLGKSLFTIQYFYNGGGGHSTTTLEFKYSKKANDWLLDNYSLESTSDTPTNAGGYDNTTLINKTSKDFGQISFSNFKRETIKY
jgi:hypothetical protein